MTHNSSRTDGYHIATIDDHLEPKAPCPAVAGVTTDQLGVDFRDLVKNAIRLRTKLLIPGEVSGGEAIAYPGKGN